MTKAEIATILRSCRKRHSISQERLAADAAVDRTYVGGDERGQRNPSVIVMCKLLTAMNATWVEIAPELDKVRIS
jgi:transcriptional regulator with XRE-family HTH domain